MELLAPGGDVNAVKAAILTGADAVYCGLAQFNARNRARNLTFEELIGVINLAHDHDCKIYLTLNIVLLETEIPTVIALLNKLVNIDLNGIIIQDLGLLYLLSKYFKTLDVHASTQMTTHNRGQLEFLARNSVKQVNLSRELNLNEINELCKFGNEKQVETEVFAHGSYCIGFSGLCYMSSVLDGKSGNRGRCSQPCRNEYRVTPKGIKYPLNLKDNSAYLNLPELIAAGIDSLKIEGRIKGYDYVHRIVRTWRRHLDNYFENRSMDENIDDLYSVFNRDFSNGYLTGKISREMFIDNPRDFSLDYQLKSQPGQTVNRIIEEREKRQQKLHQKISAIEIGKIPLTIEIQGRAGQFMIMMVKSPDKEIKVQSRSKLQPAVNKKSVINKSAIGKKLRNINNTNYQIDFINTENLQEGLFLPFRELTELRNEIISEFIKSDGLTEPVRLSELPNSDFSQRAPGLSILISDFKDIQLCRQASAGIFFELPNYLEGMEQYIEVFRRESRLIPWFPAILIGENYTRAVDFLDEVMPKMIVTNNTGIANAARKRNIPWIAGPQLNLTNSYSLRCLQERLGCSGGFISNELNKYQINSINCPKNFSLYFSIFHPILMMQTRQCLLQQIIEYQKVTVDTACLFQCQKSATITNLNNRKFYIHKRAGCFTSVYNDQNYLNTEVLRDLPGKFSGVMIDLRNIQTNTTINTDKTAAIDLFASFVKGNKEYEIKLRKIIKNTTKQQFNTGI
ncbi:MAG: DUF3656 domain-containing protein [Fidelibacterota bacterium]